VYTAIRAHIQRAAGRTIWGKKGPLYEVQNGHAHYVGSFSEHNLGCDNPDVPRSVIDKFLHHSRIWQFSQAYAGPYFCPAPNDENTLIRDRTRFLEIVKASNVIAQQKYQSRFVVILWDIFKPSQDYNWIEAKLVENNIPTLRLSSEIKQADFKNWIIKRDGHPNPRAYREVAQMLLSWLKQNPTMSLSHSQ
jgi:hypothetical protein